MNTETKRDDIAAKRLMYITPLLEEGLDPARITALKNDISQKEGTSPRSLGRYIAAYQKEGFEGLKPKTGKRRNAHTLPPNYDVVVEQAIILRRELPSRSVPQIMNISV